LQVLQSNAVTARNTGTRYRRDKTERIFPERMAKPFCCWIQISAEEKPFHNDPGVKYSAGGSAIHSNPGFSTKLAIAWEFF
jgi:hypothetical protein